MKDKIFLLVCCTVETDHRDIHDAITEFQEQTQIQVQNTPHVKVSEVAIIKMNTKSGKG
jgi:nitrogenase molybdenum-iron protein alpha/beta subunit